MDIDVDAVILIGGVAIQSHAEMDWLAIRAWTHHQMQISRIEVKRDGPGRLVEHAIFIMHGPAACQCPLIELQSRWLYVDLGLIARNARRRAEVSRTLVSDIGFRRLDLRFIGSGLNAGGLNPSVARRR